MSQSKITLLFGIFIVLLFSACDLRQTKALKDHGIETEATVMRKDVSVAVRVNNRHHYLNVSFFAESGPKKDDHSINVLADTTLTMAERLDKWEPGKMDMGTYTTIQIEVQPVTGTHYAPGDKVKIVYLPEDPTVAMLKEELHD